MEKCRNIYGEKDQSYIKTTGFYDGLSFYSFLVLIKQRKAMLKQNQPIEMAGKPDLHMVGTSKRVFCYMNITFRYI